MKRIIVLLIVLQGVVIGFFANAQVTETKMETVTQTASGKEIRTETSTRTEGGNTQTTTYAGGVYTITDTNSDVSFGLKIDANMSGLILKNVPNTQNNMGYGVSFGGFMKAEFQRGFALQFGLDVHHKMSEMEYKLTDTKLDYEYWGVEIPMYYMRQFNIGSGKMYVGAGYYVGVGLDAQYVAADGSAINLYKKNEITGDTPMQRWDFGFGVS